jgi:hypothetical protein
VDQVLRLFVHLPDEIMADVAIIGNVVDDFFIIDLPLQALRQFRSGDISQRPDVARDCDEAVGTGDYFRMTVAHQFVSLFMKKHLTLDHVDTTRQFSGFWTGHGSLLEIRYMVTSAD